MLVQYIKVWWYGHHPSSCEVKIQNFALFSVAVSAVLAEDGDQCLTNLVPNKTLIIHCYERVDVTEKLTTIIDENLLLEELAVSWSALQRA